MLQLEGMRPGSAGFHESLDQHPGFYRREAMHALPVIPDTAGVSLHWRQGVRFALTHTQLLQWRLALPLQSTRNPKDKEALKEEKGKPCGASG